MLSTRPPQAHDSPFHPHPVVTAFPHAGSSGLADHPRLARAVHVLALPLGAFHPTLDSAAALHLFDRMPHRTSSSWYTAVSGCVRCGLDSAFALLRGMRERDVPLSGFALASLVTACERRGWEEGAACGAAIHESKLDDDRTCMGTSGGCTVMQGLPRFSS